MHDSLERTRPTLPPACAVERPRVVEALWRATQRTVTLVAAPIGYGKSRAAADALAGVPLRNIPDDATSLADVALAVAEAVAADAPGLHLAFAACARRAFASREPGNVFAAWLAEYIRGRAQTVAIDDLDAALRLPDVSPFLTTLVARAKADVRWILITRELGSLPVARWLAEGIATVPVDEGVLALRPDELRLYTDARSVDRSALAGVEPRPATVALACDLLVSGASRREVAAHARSLKELAGLAFAEASADERHLLALAAHLVTIDDTLVAALPLARAGDLLERVRERLPSAIGATGLASWFRSSIRDRIADDPRYAQVAAEAVVAYESAGRPLDALRLALRSDDLATVGAIVTRHGERFLDSGTPPVVAAALSRLDLNVENAPVLAMQAIVEGQRGRHDTSEAYFVGALRHATGAVRTTIVHRFALELSRRGRPDAVTLLEEHLASSQEPAQTLGPLRSTLATAYAMGDRHADAKVQIDAADAAQDLGADLNVQARMAHQRAFVALRRGDATEARTSAERAIALGEEAGAYDVASRAHTVLYELAYDADDSVASLAALEGVAHFASLAGETGLRTFALLGAYDLQANDGDEDAMRRIEEALADFDMIEAPEGTLRALLPGRALAHAWRASFDRAYRMLSGSAAGEQNPGQRAIRYAEIARYAAAAGLGSEAREAIAAADSELHQVTESARRDRVLASLALAAVLLGDDEGALRRLLATIAGERGRRTTVLLDAVALYRLRAQGEATAQELVEVLDRARDRGFGGFARLIEALPRRPLGTSAAPGRR